MGSANCLFVASMARTILATTRKMLQGTIKRDAWFELVVARHELSVANHALLLSRLDFIAEMMAARLDEADGGFAVSRVVVGLCSSYIVISMDFVGAVIVLLSLIKALEGVIFSKIFCHVCVFY